MEAVSEKSRFGWAVRLFGRMVLSDWVLARTRQPLVLTVLRQIAYDIGHPAAARLQALSFSADSFPEGDYVSPGFARVKPDVCFPNLTIGDQRNNDWAYLRRDAPHNWYVDRRLPHIGFVNRDEAHILYNTALQATGRPALEIGCLLGWSTCHLALAGVQLDVVDPLLARADCMQSVTASLEAAGVLHHCRLMPTESPSSVERLAAEGRRWNLIFIDGNHLAPAPAHDAAACELSAAPDCIVLFHDLYAPAVAEGLRYFKHKGWKVRVYNTAQVMGVAWRGAMRPVDHVPDPRLGKALPAHLDDLL